jgi:protein-L-isoaspartate(D-aspartate) O-methyltransferase
MAWHCSATTNAGMVDALQREGLIKTSEVAEVMRRVDRGFFVRNPDEAYLDQPLPIGYGVTISAPHMHAIMLELVSPSVLNHKRLDRGYRQPLRLLDIGSGSGYMTAAFAALCEAAGHGDATPMFDVVGVEHVPELLQQSEKALTTHFPRWMQEQRVTLLHGDGLKPRSIAGAGIGPGNAFDVIHVGATAPHTVVPEYLRLLRNGGTLVIPVGEATEVQELRVFTKNAEGEVSMQRVCDVQFVPLTTLDEQLERDRSTSDL